MHNAGSSSKGQEMRGRSSTGSRDREKLFYITFDSPTLSSMTLDPTTLRPYYDPMTFRTYNPF